MRLVLDCLSAVCLLSGMGTWEQLNVIQWYSSPVSQGECGTLPVRTTVLVVCWWIPTRLLRFDLLMMLNPLCLCAAGICHHCSGAVGGCHLWLGSGDCDVGWCPLCDGT